MENKSGLALAKRNLMLIAAGFVIVIIGFCFMIGGGAEGTAFNPAIYSARYITIGPVISVIGFFFIIFAILYKPKANDSEIVESKNEEVK